MKTTLSSYDFLRAFEDAGRKDQFSRAALFALFDYLEQLEQDTGEEIDLDVVALCCDYAEHASALDCAKEYGETFDDEGDEDDQEEAALEWLRDRTQVIEFSGGIVIQNF